MFTKLLVPSDGSDHALRAASAAGKVAQKLSASVTILHVFTVPTAHMPLAGSPGIELDLATVNRMAEEVFDAVSRRTGQELEACGIQYESLLEMGHPAEVILRVAELGRYDLIVMGSRGHSELRSFLLGSVSDRVLHHAHCPVLIIR